MSDAITATITRVIWFSRHSLTDTERRALRDLYGNVEIESQNVSFLSVSHCLSRIGHEADQAEQVVYLSPLPLCMMNALDASDIVYHYFDGKHLGHIPPLIDRAYRVNNGRAELIWHINDVQTRSVASQTDST